MANLVWQKKSELEDVSQKYSSVCLYTSTDLWDYLKESGATLICHQKQAKLCDH